MTDVAKVPKAPFGSAILALEESLGHLKAPLPTDIPTPLLTAHAGLEGAREAVASLERVVLHFGPQGSSQEQLASTPLMQLANNPNIQVNVRNILRVAVQTIAHERNAVAEDICLSEIPKFSKSDIRERRIFGCGAKTLPRLLAFLATAGIELREE